MLHFFDPLKEMFDCVDALHIYPKFVVQPGYTFCLWQLADRKISCLLYGCDFNEAILMKRMDK